MSSSLVSEQWNNNCMNSPIRAITIYVTHSGYSMHVQNNDNCLLPDFIMNLQGSNLSLNNNPNKGFIFMEQDWQNHADDRRTKIKQYIDELLVYHQNGNIRKNIPPKTNCLLLQSLTSRK